MINLVKCDIRRIIKKKAFIIALLVIVLLAVATALDQMGTNWNGFAYMYSIQSQLSVYNLVLSALIFLGVYGDEFKAMAMTIAIGRGISRNKLIIAKMVDNIIMSIIVFGLFTVAIVAVGILLGANMTSEEIFALAFNIMLGAYKSIGYAALASIILFVNANVPIGLFLLLIMHVVLPIIIGTLATSSKLLSAMHLDRWFYGGIADSGYSSILLGMPVRGIFTLIMGFVIYVGISLIITIWLFSKREMDF